MLLVDLFILFVFGVIAPLLLGFVSAVADMEIFNVFPGPLLLVTVLSYPFFFIALFLNH